MLFYELFTKYVGVVFVQYSSRFEQVYEFKSVWNFDKSVKSSLRTLYIVRLRTLAMSAYKLQKSVDLFKRATDLTSPTCTNSPPNNKKIFI